MTSSMRVCFYHFSLTIHVNMMIRVCIEMRKRMLYIRVSLKNILKYKKTYGVDSSRRKYSLFFYLEGEGEHHYHNTSKSISLLLIKIIKWQVFVLQTHMESIQNTKIYSERNRITT